MEEKIIKLGKDELILTPSFRALRTIEIRTGEKFLEYINRFVQGRYGVDDIAIALYAFSSDKRPYDEFAEEVFREGFMRYVPILTEIFTDIINAGGSGN